MGSGRGLDAPRRSALRDLDRRVDLADHGLEHLGMLFRDLLDGRLGSTGDFDREFGLEFAIADDAKQNCPVSKALSAVPISLDAELTG